MEDMALELEEQRHHDARMAAREREAKERADLAAEVAPLKAQNAGLQAEAATAKAMAAAVECKLLTLREVNAELLDVAEHYDAFLGAMAVTLLEWARESSEHGWSTHQVDANKTAAEECRKRGPAVRAAINHAKEIK